jgi:hypothetical protein
MKHILVIVMLVVISIVLFGGTRANVTKIEGRVLVIDKGAEQGVEIGMKGQVLRFLEDSTSGEKVPITVGKFQVRKVDKNSSELLVREIAEGAELTMDVKVEFDEILLSPGQKKEKIIEYIKKDKLADAAELLEKSLRLKKNDKGLILLKDGLHLLFADKVSVKEYNEYKAKEPGEVILEALWKKLKAKNANLPPGKYLDASLLPAQNGEGYYEITITFKDNNSHVMIYIPGKNFFIDKFEVSNARYLQFANKQGIAVRKIIFSDPDLANYPGCCKDYPAIVSYQEAEKYCAAYNLRLPREAEWEEIAGFSKGYVYSWGNKEVNEAGVYRANYEAMDDEDGHIEAAPVNSFTGYSSPYGAVNMSGNVSEWVIEKFSKGGSLLSEPGDLKITGKYTDPIYVGFRCIMEAGQ